MRNPTSTFYLKMRGPLAAGAGRSTVAAKINAAFTGIGTKVEACTR